MSRTPRSLSLLLFLSLLLSACAIQPIQPAAGAPAEVVTAVPSLPVGPPPLTEEESAALAVIEAFGALAASHPMSANNLDEYMAFYADDATMSILGTVGDQNAYQGKDRIRSYYLGSDAASATVFTFEILSVAGNTVTTRTLSEGNDQDELAISPYEGTEIFVVVDGKIQEDTWVWAPDSLEESLEAYATRWGYDVRAKSPLKGFDAVQAALAQWDSETPTMEAVNQSLRWYADDVVFTMLGWQGGPQVIVGKDALRQLMEQWVAGGTRIKLEPLSVSGNQLRGRSLIWDAESLAGGYAPLVGLSIYVLQSGLIAEETWTISPDSYVQLMAAMGE